jgi:enolase-phosphatase E1
LKAWHQKGIQLYVYSSGSVYAQKLLFGYSDFGDMTPLFSGYFDTTTGAKGDAGSYQKITAAINLPALDILFLSDIDKELDAAHAAGMKTVWLVRNGKMNARATHPQVNSFNDINVAAM